MLHINRMVFGVPEDRDAAHVSEQSGPEKAQKLAFSCRLTLLLAAVPVLLFGFYIPRPLSDLLTQAAAALTK
jgi:hypothetical protein